MNRLPIRWRLTILSALVMTLVLSIAGFVLYERFSAEIRSAVDAGLLSRAETVAAGVGESGTNFGDGGLVESDQAFSQVLGHDGSVLDSSAALGGEPILTPQQVSLVSGPTFSSTSVTMGDEPGDVRLLATPAAGGAVVVVGASLEDEQSALERLTVLLSTGIPIAIAVTTVLAWVLAGAALRPIDRMREEAAVLSGHSDLNVRLSVPASGDEVSRLGETLNEMLDRLQGTVTRERRLVDDASHELRTPLGILRMELELALKEPRSEESLRAAIVSGIEETDRLVELAEALLVLARFERGSLPVDPVPIDLSVLVAETVASFQHRAAEAEVDLWCRGQEHVEAVIDPARIRQVIMNLLDNALAHAPRGGEVTARVDVEGQGVVLRVADTGEGFDEALLAHAFEPFSRADVSRSRTSGGTGLGLAIVRAIIEAHGGTVEASNRPDGGALVTCLLPGEP